jgi:RES domain-containing protein
MLNPPALAAALAGAPPLFVSLATLAFRAIHLQHFANFAAVQPLFAAPGGAAGSRYVQPHGPAALYAALDADTAHREGNQAFYQLAANPPGQLLIGAGGLRPDPVVLIGAYVRGWRLLDLCDPVTCLRLGIQATSELLGPWRGVPNAPTQVLGDAVFNNGQYEGIIYPSAQHAGHSCLVLFPARLLAPVSLVHFFDPVTGLAAQRPP